MYSGYVIKYPRNTKAKDIMPSVATMQTELSKKMDEVLPCENLGYALLMPRASGASCRDLSREEWNELSERVQALSEIANSYGYDISDLTRSNVFYDKRRDCLYLVDCHTIKKAKKEGTKEGD